MAFKVSLITAFPERGLTSVPAKRTENQAAALGLELEFSELRPKIFETLRMSLLYTENSSELLFMVSCRTIWTRGGCIFFSRTIQRLCEFGRTMSSRDRLSPP